MKMPRETGVVIVGGGHAGGRAAERLRAFGYKEPITIIGREPHLPYERPPLSKAVLTDSNVRSTPELLSTERWEELDVHLICGITCDSINIQGKSVHLSDGRVLPYTQLVLATGLTPRSLPNLGAIKGQVYSLHTYDDAMALREHLKPGARVGIIGAGFVGLEVAASARTLGAEVTIIEMAERPLSRVFNRTMSDWFVQLHQGHGVSLMCAKTIADVRSEKGAAKLSLDDGQNFEFDLVVTGIGGVPNVELAQTAGLKIDNGIVINRKCQTSAPDVYAVGDIANMLDERTGTAQRLESWKYAEDTAAVVAHVLCDQDGAYDQVPWFWTDQFEHNIQIVGQLQEGATVFARGKPGDPKYLAYYLDADMLLGAVGLDCGGDLRRARAAMEKKTPITAKALAKMGLASNHVQPASPVVVS